MQPENPQTSPNPQPAQPAQPPVPPFQPAPTAAPVQQSAPQPTSFPQPAASTQAMTGMKPPTSANIAKQKKFALIAAILSIVIFVISLFVGYVFAAAALLGAYGVAVGIRSNPKLKLVIALGAIGAVLNLALYIFSIVAK